MTRSYVKKKEEEKRNKIINIVFIVIIIGLVGALAIMVSSNTKNIKNENRIVELTYEEYTDKIKRDEYTIILLTQPNCGHCNNYKPFVNYVANEYDLEIYDINVSSKDLTYDQYIQLHSYSALADQYSDGEAVIKTPTTVLIKNGVEVSSITGDLGYDGFIDFLASNNVITKK